ncbi:unnamed protein product [Symbiodinium natans]|uniref:Uncharacterized protein n=1 Tax=Symbiodinium natans TaxID=878477 RepID=A0A812RKZ9_9DINO|nr:unnamed protein product [Symbiodinium natans]
MGGVISSCADNSALVGCPTGRASHSFPLRVSVEAARAAAAAAMGSAMPALVVGYSTALTKEAGAASIRLQLKPGPKASYRSNLSSAAASCATISLRAEGRLGFLAGIASVIRKEDGLFLEVVVFGRPNELLQELMPLDESVLESLYRLGAIVDVRFLRSLPWETAELQEEELRTADVPPNRARALDPAEAASEAAPTRSAKAEWLVERLLSLASTLESQFGTSRHDSEATYEGCELDSEGVVSWLREAGLQITGNMFIETR